MSLDVLTVAIHLHLDNTFLLNSKIVEKNLIL
jgi:hypothetical protein